MDVLFAPTSVVQPDLLFIRKERLHIVTEPNIQGAPDLVVEILSPPTAALDRGAKMLLYAKYGVPHYWILDSDRLILEIYELQEGDYKLMAQFSKEDQMQSPLFPGLTISMVKVGQ